MAGVDHSASSRSAVVGGVEHLGGLRAGSCFSAAAGSISTSSTKRKPSRPTASDSTIIRSCAMGAMAQDRRCSAVGGSLDQAGAGQERARPADELLDRQRAQVGGVDRLGLLQVEAGRVGAHPVTSKASTISAIVKMSRSSAIDQPSSAR